MLRSCSFLTILSVALLGVSGCGGSDAPTNIAADADAQAIADYEAAVAADAAAMSATEGE